MKQWIAAMMAAALMFCAGCAQQPKVNVDASAAADKIIASVKFDDQMSAVDDKTAQKLYGFGDGVVRNMKVYESTGATAEEVAVFEAKDEASAQTVKKAAQDRIENQKEGFQDYQPKEMTKLKNPVLVQSGKYVVLCVSNDNTAAQKAIDGIMK